MTGASRRKALSHAAAVRAARPLSRRPERTLVVVAVGGFAAALLVIAATWAPVAIATATALLVLAVAADVDRREFRLPDSLVALAAVPLAIASVGSIVLGRIDVVAAMLLGTAFLAGPVAGLHLLSPAAMGFGDVKLAVVLGAAVGLIEPSLALVALCAASGTAGMWGSFGRRRVVAFGPFLVVAASMVLVVAASLEMGDLSWR